MHLYFINRFMCAHAFTFIIIIINIELYRIECLSGAVCRPRD